MSILYGYYRACAVLAEDAVDGGALDAKRDGPVRVNQAERLSMPMTSTAGGASVGVAAEGAAARSSGIILPVGLTYSGQLWFAT